MESFFIDLFKEVSNIGTGNAATSLSVLLNKSVGIELPEISIVRFNEIDFGEKKVVATIIETTGEITGLMMFITSIESVKKLTSILLGGAESPGDEINEMEMSAIKEISNIMFNSYLTSITKLFNISYDATIPAVCIDMLQTIYTIPATLMAKYADRAIIVDSILNINDMSLNAEIAFVPDEQFVNFIQGLKG